MRIDNIADTEDYVHVQRIVETVAAVRDVMNICGFLCPEGKDDVFEAIIDNELVLRVVFVMNG